VWWTEWAECLLCQVRNEKGQGDLGESWAGTEDVRGIGWWFGGGWIRFFFFPTQCRPACLLDRFTLEKTSNFLLDVVVYLEARKIR
jgi:hypothetical protein